MRCLSTTERVLNSGDHNLGASLPSGGLLSTTMSKISISADPHLGLSFVDTLSLAPHIGELKASKLKSPEKLGLKEVVVAMARVQCLSRWLGIPSNFHPNW